MEEKISLRAKEEKEEGSRVMEKRKEAVPAVESAYLPINKKSVRHRYAVGTPHG